MAIGKRTLLLLSIGICLYLLLVVALHYFNVTWVMLGVVTELFTIPVLLLQAVLLGIGLLQVSREGFRSRQLVVALVLLLAAYSVWFLP
jgi:hypothetical protein